MKGDGVVLDGELIAADADGVPRLHKVMERWHQGRLTRRPVPVNIEIFDILYQDGRPLLKEPLYARKAALNETARMAELLNVA